MITGTQAFQQPPRTGSTIKVPASSVVIHLLHRNRPLCGFSRLPPEHWRTGHVWAPWDKSEIVTCPICQKLGAEIKAARH